MNKEELTKLIRGAYASSRAYAERCEHSKTPGVKTLGDRAQGRADAYLAVLDALERNLTYLIACDVRGTIKGE
jgi:hypothetical protein